MTKVSIIIVNFNLKDVILSCLRSAKNLKHADLSLEIVVVDNNSTDGSSEAIKQTFPEITYIQNQENLGFSGGNNIGMKYAYKNGADFVVILNPDVVVDPNLIHELYRGFTSTPSSFWGAKDERLPNPSLGTKRFWASQNDGQGTHAHRGVGITAPKVYFASGYEFHKDRYTADDLGKVIWYAGGIMDWNNVLGSHRGVDEVDHGQYDEPSTTDFASGNCMMIKRDVLDKVGYFDERYFLYYEDADYCQRVKKAGFAIQYVPRAILWHKNAQASGGSGNPLQDYFITRNRLLFGYTYAPLRTKFALFRESIRNFFSYPTRRLAVKDYYMGKFGKGSYLT